MFKLYHSSLVTPPTIGQMNGLYVCVFFCPRSYLRNYTSDLHQIFVHVTYGCGLVLLWRRSDTLCTSGFMDDVIFAHKPSLLDVAAQLKRSAHAASGLAICAVIPVAGHRTHGTTFRSRKVTSQVATPGAESVVYDCVVVCVWLHCKQLHYDGGVWRDCIYHYCCVLRHCPVCRMWS